MLYDRGNKLPNAHLDLVRLVTEVGNTCDILVIETYRGKKAQDAAFKLGKSKLEWPKSKHNKKPSLAIDIAPVTNGTIDWGNFKAFKDLAKVVLHTAESLDIKIRWGGDFNMNGIADDKFVDMPHYELIQ